jgi:hypothetical protein
MGQRGRMRKEGGGNQALQADKYCRCERWAAILSSSLSPVSPGSITNFAPNRLSNVAFMSLKSHYSA